MSYNVRVITPYPGRKGGISTYSRNLATALVNLTGEVGAVRIAAIDNNHQQYSAPVDIVIDQYKATSWLNATQDMLRRANEMKDPTVILFQHEYGLDPDEEGNDCQGDNFVKMAEDIEATRNFRNGKIISLVYLHTVLTRPNEHQRTTLQKLAEYTDGLIVPAHGAIDILVKNYGIDSSRIHQIHHGIRMYTTSEYDRLNVKKGLRLENIFLFTTLGLKSPDKGIQYGIQGYAEFIKSSCDKEERSKLLYLIAGQSHPTFIKANGGRDYRKYQKTIDDALSKSGLNIGTANSMEEFFQLDLKKYDIIVLDTFLDEEFLLKLYAATNIMMLPYLNQQQICSGVLADTLGSGRVAIATKSVYSVEMLYAKPLSIHKRGIIGIKDPHARGILIDPREPDQIAEGSYYLAGWEEDRLAMEDRSRSIGYGMAWPDVTHKFIQHVGYVREKKLKKRGRGVRVNLNPNSVYAERIKSKTK